MAKRKNLRSEIRKDYIQDKYVIIAPRRGTRPHAVRPPSVPDPTKGGICGLCPSRIDREKALLTVKGRTGWQIKVVPNRYPAVSKGNKDAYGIQEVVIETPHPFKQLEELSERTIARLLEVYAKRTREISKDPRIQYLIIFKNDGGRAGASLNHSHSQIFATNFIPPHLVDKSKKVFEYVLMHGSCPYCSIIEEERKGPRLVYEDEHVVAFTPYASMHNYELWILPRRHLDNITALNNREKVRWARVMKRALKAIGEMGLSYNYYFHQVIYDRDQHFYMKITPRRGVWTGVEIGSGIIINSTPPEEAASYYRGFFR